jgi:hypothetical protein
MAQRSEFESRYGQEFSLSHVVQTGCGVQRVPGALSPGLPLGIEPGHEAEHTPPSVEVKKIWIYISTSPYAFMA